MPTHPGHPAIASTTLVSASRSLLNDAFDSVSLQTVTATATLNPDDGRYVLVAPASHATITLPDPSSDERYQNVRLVLKRTTAGVYTATVVVAGGGLIDGSSSTTLNAQYDCEVLFSDGTAWHRLRDQTNLLAPDYLDFGDWIVGTDDSNPAPVATSDAYTAPDGTTTADELEWDNTTELADESWAEPGAASIEAGDTAQYSFYIDSEVGDGVKTVLEVGDSSVPQITEQATVAFSNVFAEDHAVSLSRLYPNLGFGATTTSAVEDPDGGTTATRYEGAVSPRIELSDSWIGGFGIGREFTYSVYFLAEADTRRLELNLANNTANASVTDTVNAVFDISASAGVVLSSFTSASSGPSYSSADSYRAEQVSGTAWWKVSVRIVDYTASGNGAQTFVRFKTGSNATDNFVAWRHELRYGNHITGQQLLTVDDGVENLLRTVSVEDFSDFTTNGTVSTSSIAAPDGTLTAQDIAYTVTGATYIQKTAADYGSVWKLGAGWSSSFYFYQPTLPGNVQFDTYIYNSGGTQINNFRTTINSSGALIAFGGTAVYGPAFTAERNLDLRKIGDTGWYQVTVFIGDYGVAADEFLFIRLVNQTAGGTYTYWNPTLRYGDWVSRGKNWLTANDLSAWSYSSTDAQLEPSSTPAPDGTLSAYDFSTITTADTGTSSGFHTIPTTGGAWTYEFWINHAGADWDDGKIYFYLRSSAGWVERVYVRVAVGGGATVINNILTAGPGYTLADHVQQEAIGPDGWWRYRITLFDYGNNAITSVHYWYVQDSGSAGRSTIWNPRLTVGNPADARGYFVSGPQNLLGDGSDIGSWTTSGGSTVTTNTEVAPNGRLEADTIQNTQGVFGAKLKAANVTPTANATYDFIIYFKRDASALAGASELTFAPTLYTSGYAGITERVTFRVSKEDPSTSTLTGSVSGGPGYLLDDLSITALSNDWYRWHIRLQDYNGTAAHISYRLESAGSGYGTGAAYDITVAAAEVTTIDRTPTATDLRPISGGIVDYDAYPAEHRSLFAGYEDAGDNWYKVTMNLTEPN